MERKLSVMLIAVFCLLFGGKALAQSTVSGTVFSSEDDSPIIGASIKIQGTKMGAATDIDGKFRLENVKKGATLVVTYIGMQTKTVKAGENMKIYLTSDSKSLDEVVVQVAYGAAKKSTLTGAVTQVDSKQIEVRPVSSVTSALEGTTSGVQINSTYGQPGEEPSIRIRGFGTVNGSATPLYVLDGVPFGGNISDLNSNDIESITVLKDAASCALYGNRASNGVILITTKRGKGEKMAFNLKVNQGTYSRGIKEYKVLNAKEFMETSWLNLRNSRISAGDDQATANAYASKNLINDELYLNIYNKADDQLFDANGKLVSDAQIMDGYADDLDWYDNAIRDGYRQEYNFSGSQASAKSDYYFSVGYLNEKGYVTNSDFDRLTGRAAMNFHPKKWLNTGFTISGSHQKSNITNGNSSASYTNAFMFCRDIAPIYPVHLHNADGSYQLDSFGNKQYDSGSYTDENGNPVLTRNQYQDRHVIWENELNENKSFRNTLQSSAYMDLKFLNDFTFTVKGELNVRNNENRTYNSALIGDGKGNNGRTKRTIYRYKNYTFQQQLNWNHTFGNHTVGVLLGHENYSYFYDYTYIYKTNQTFAGQDNLDNFTNLTNGSGYSNRYRTESYLGRIRYDYQEKYNVEASFRRDGSSRFAKESRWGNFGSIGASWVVTKEDFMKPISWVNNLKLRADYGLVGNDAGASYYSYMALYASNQNHNKGAYYLSQLANTKLKWETGASFGIGVDARLFNRWNISAEYFDKRNKDLLFDVYLPLSAGATSSSSAEATITENMGTISNRGFEINTDVDIFKNKDWTVNFSANASFIKNKIVELPEQDKDGIISGIYKIAEGKSRYEFFTYTYVGVDQMTGNSLYKANLENYHVTTADGQTVGNADGNDISKYVTQIGNEYYVNNTSYALKEYHGSAIPKVYGSFAPSVRYKDLSLSLMFTYSIGGKVYDAVYSSLMSTGTSPSNYHKDILKSWSEIPSGMTEDSQDRIWYGGIPQINSSMTSTNNATSSRWLTDASYLVLKNINMSYSLPKAWVNALTLESIRLNLSCENAFTCTKRRGMNPQQSFNGYQYNYLVTPRVFTIGVDVKF
mgnify:FL=1